MNTLKRTTGFKFEALFTIPDIWDNVSRDEIEGRNSKVVSNYAQYCSVVKTGIGNLDMVIGGEVDASMFAALLLGLLLRMLTAHHSLGRQDRWT